EPPPPAVRDPQHPTAGRALGPPPLEQPAQELRAERPRNVMRALGPVEAGTGELPPGGTRSGHVHSQPVGEEPGTRLGKLIMPVVAMKHPPLHEGAGEGDAESASEVVTAGAGVPQVSRDGGASMGQGRSRACQRTDGLERRDHPLSAHAVVAMSSMPLDLDQPSLEQPAQVLARSRRAHPRLPGELSGGSHPPVREGAENYRTRRIRDQRGYRRDGSITDHLPLPLNMRVGPLATLFT